MNAKQQQLVFELAEKQMKARFLKEFEQKKEQWNHRAIVCISLSFAMILFDKYDWKVDDINNLIEYARNHFIDISNKYLTLDDIKEACKEIGIKGL